MTTSVMHQDNFELDPTANSASSNVQRQLRHALNSCRLSSLPDIRSSHLQMRHLDSSVTECEKGHGEYIVDESKTENSDVGALSVETKHNIQNDDDNDDATSPTLTNLSADGRKSPTAYHV